MIYRSIVEGGTSINILYSNSWYCLDSPNLVFTTYLLQGFYTRRSEPFYSFSISYLCRCNYLIYAMDDMLYSLFHVMHIPCNAKIITIYQLNYLPLFVPTILVDTTPPWVTYMVSYPKC